MASDYWLVKKQNYDLPALYDPHGRYRYIGGFNWRAVVAFTVPVAPLLPGLAESISGASVVHVDAGILNLYSFDWLFGFVVSIFLYAALSWLFPAKETLLTETIWGLDGVAVDGVNQGIDIENQKEGEKKRDHGHPLNPRVL